MLQFNVRGRNYDEISKATDELTAWMKTQPGYVDVDVSYRGGKPEVAINIDRDRAADLGVPIAAIASTVRSMMAGDKVSEISSDGQRWDVRLRLDEVFRQKAGDLLAFKIRSTTGPLRPARGRRRSTARTDSARSLSTPTWRAARPWAPA
jgi:HAE1 family hydrophobic/amphiphilic exporter-1